MADKKQEAKSKEQKKASCHPIYILSDTPVPGAEVLPVIDICFLGKKVDLSTIDAVVFTSKNAVRALERTNPEWKRLPVLAIGTATAQEALLLGGSVRYQSKDSHGDVFAREILERFRGLRLFYPRAKKVASNVAKILQGGGIDLVEEIVYETVCSDCKKLAKPQRSAVIIFSSPSTIECFLKCFEWDDSYRAVAIGRKTAEFIPPHIPYRLSPSPSLAEAVLFAKTLS